MTAKMKRIMNSIQHFEKRLYNSDNNHNFSGQVSNTNNDQRTRGQIKKKNNERKENYLHFNKEKYWNIKPHNIKKAQYF